MAPKRAKINQGNGCAAKKAKADNVDGPAESKQLAQRLAREYETYCDALGIDLKSADGEALFQWLTASILFSTRISEKLALQAARAVYDAGLTTPEAIVKTTWEERADLLKENGYRHYGEKTATYLDDTAKLVLEKYEGDLHKLREAADRSYKKERELLGQVKGVGNVGLDIFFREAQTVFTEAFPFADKKALQAAGKLGLPSSANELAALVDDDVEQFTRLVAGLVKIDLTKAYDKVLGTDAG